MLAAAQRACLRDRYENQKNSRTFARKVETFVFSRRRHSSSFACFLWTGADAASQSLRLEFQELASALALSLKWSQTSQSLSGHLDPFSKYLFELLLDGSDKARSPKRSVDFQTGRRFLPLEDPHSGPSEPSQIWSPRGS